MQLKSLSELIGAAKVRQVNAPLKDAVGLPGRAYYDPEVWELERKTIFNKGWFAAAYASEVPNPGDVMPLMIAGYELLFVRGSDDRVRCFHNLCRHRGTKLVTKSSNVQNIQCGWHCWTYNLTGELFATPRIGGHRVNEAEGLEHDKLGLLPVRAEQWQDVLFVNIDGQAPPLAEHLKPLTDHIARFDIADVQLGAASASEVEISANWKVFLEGGLEGYHLPFVHPALEQPPMYEITIGGNCFIDTAGTLTKYKRIGAKEGQLPPFPLLKAAIEAEALGERLPYSLNFTLPTAIVAAWPDHLMISLVRPVSLNKTTLRRRFYFLGNNFKNPAYAEARESLVALHDNVAREDLDYSAEVNRLARLRDEIHLDTRFAPYWEGAVRAFQQYILRNTTL
jgi:choline monooxygenase